MQKRAQNRESNEPNMALELTAWGRTRPVGALWAARIRPSVAARQLSFTSGLNNVAKGLAQTRAL